MIFQSTLPLRGATGEGLRSQVASTYFNPRSPYGERLDVAAFWKRQQGFQSTLPLRGATNISQDPGPKRPISIHAPLTGSDRLRLASWYHPENFNPRSPYGERLPKFLKKSGGRHFNPRSPYGERPLELEPITHSRFISIHAPLTGSDYYRPTFNGV